MKHRIIPQIVQIPSYYIECEAFVTRLGVEKDVKWGNGFSPPLSKPRQGEEFYPMYELWKNKKDTKQNSLENLWKNVSVTLISSFQIRCVLSVEPLSLL